MGDLPNDGGLKRERTMTTDHASGPSPEIMEVLVCRGPACGDETLARALAAEIERAGLTPQVRLERHNCRGLCIAGPTVTLLPRGILYCRVKPEDAAEIVEETLVEGRVISRLT